MTEPPSAGLSRRGFLKQNCRDQEGRRGQWLKQSRAEKPGLMSKFSLVFHSGTWGACCLGLCGGQGLGAKDVPCDGIQIWYLKMCFPLYQTDFLFRF